MNELKPCPFCGGEAETKMYLWGTNSQTGEPIWLYYVFCIKCNSMSDNVFQSKKDAINAWNRRHNNE